MGRFITADSIVPNASDPQELNRYSYVNNNPVKYTDPSGHKKKKRSWWKVLIGAAVLAAAIFTGMVVGALLAAHLGFSATAGAFLGGVAGGALGGTANAAINGGNIGSGALGGAVAGATAGQVGSLLDVSYAATASGLASGQQTKAREFVQAGAQLLGDFGVTEQVLGAIGKVINQTIAPSASKILRSSFLDGVNTYFVQPGKYAYAEFAKYVSSPEGQFGLKILSEFSGTIATFTFASGNPVLIPYATFFAGFSTVAKGIQVGFGKDPIKGTVDHTLSLGMGKYAEISVSPYIGSEGGRIVGSFTNKAASEYRKHIS